MTKKSAQGLVDWAYSKIGTHYLYGYKGETITKELNDYFRGAYPTVWTQNYYNIANSWIGQKACDCSGLISWYTGKLRGSWEYYETAPEKIEYHGQNLHDYIGWAIWKKGHIGIIVGDNDIIEARGQAYGCLKTKATARDFTHIIKIIDIDYEEKRGSLKNPYIDEYGDTTYKLQGFHKDKNGYWFRHTAGIGPSSYYYGETKNLENIDFYFDNDGYIDMIGGDKNLIEKMICSLVE